MEIKVGEYVRSKDGFIGRVKDIICKGYPIRILEGYIVLDDENGTILNPEEVKHSFNIKELIENKDILKVKTKENEILMIGFDENTIDIKYKEIIEEIENGEYELLNILTHEQYERECYRLEDN